MLERRRRSLTVAMRSEVQNIAAVDLGVSRQQQIAPPWASQRVPCAGSPTQRDTDRPVASEDSDRSSSDAQIGICSWWTSVALSFCTSP
ncbi:unnamed protein product [Lampetra planeri]